MSAQVLQFCFWFGGSKLSFIPLKGGNARNSVPTFEVLAIRPLVRYKWCLFLILSLLLTFYDLYHSIFSFRRLNLVRIVYHLFLLLVKTATITVSIVFDEKSCEICKLLNSLTYLSFKIINRKPSKLFQIVYNTGTFGFGIFYLFFTPLVAIAFPCTHTSPLVRIFFTDCNSTVFRVLICFTQFAFMLPVSAIGSTGYSLLLLTLSDLSRNLENLRYVC